METPDTIKPRNSFIPGEEFISFKHLDSLAFSFVGNDGKEYTSWAIYSEPVDPDNPFSDYLHVEAIGEGYGCIDDSARVAKLYMIHFEKTGNKNSLDMAKKALEFVMYMADGTGKFYNFIDKNGVINKEGITSTNKMDWWTGRAFFSLGMGIRIFCNIDPEFTDRLRETFNQTMAWLVHYHNNPGVAPEQLRLYQERNIKPGTLVSDSGVLNAFFILGMAQRYRVDPDPLMKQLIFDLCEALVRLEERSFDRYPFYGFHYNNLNAMYTVHLYGNRQVKALAEAGKLFGEQRWINSAEFEAKRAYPRILSSWGLIFALSPDPEMFPQITYSVETIISNLLAVHQATGKDKYAVMAGLTASWLFGGNLLGEELCILKHGLCYDGINFAGLNPNSGAESVIEGLTALVEIQGTPGEEFIRFKAIDDKKRQPILISPENCHMVNGEGQWLERLLSGGEKRKILGLAAGEEVEVTVPLLTPGDYRAYLVYNKPDREQDGEITLVLNSRLHRIKLKPSLSDTHYQTSFLGKVTIEENEDIKILLKNSQQNRLFLVSSVILQPGLQEKRWTDGKRIIRMLASLRDTLTSIKVNLDHFDCRESLFMTAEGLISINLQPSDWLLMEETGKKPESVHE